MKKTLIALGAVALVASCGPEKTEKVTTDEVNQNGCQTVVDAQWNHELNKCEAIVKVKDDEKKDSKIQDLESDVIEFRADNLKNEKEINTLKTEVSDAEKSVKSSKDKVKEIEAELLVAVNTSGVSESAIADLKEKLAKEKANLKKMSEKLAQKTSALDAKSIELSEKISEFKTERETLMKKIENLESNNSGVAELKEEIDNLNIKISALEKSQNEIAMQIYMGNFGEGFLFHVDSSDFALNYSIAEGIKCELLFSVDRSGFVEGISTDRFNEFYTAPVAMRYSSVAVCTDVDGNGYQIQLDQGLLYSAQNQKNALLVTDVLKSSCSQGENSGIMNGSIFGSGPQVISPDKGLGGYETLSIRAPHLVEFNNAISSPDVFSASCEEFLSGSAVDENPMMKAACMVERDQEASNSKIGCFTATENAASTSIDFTENAFDAL